MTLILLLDIIEIRKFRITGGNVSPFVLASQITSSVFKPLSCVSCTVSL
jgi:hypothetical protein